jgi:hypothetical protein
MIESMSNELYILAGATVGPFAAYITAKITTGVQMNIAPSTPTKTSHCKEAAKKKIGLRIRFL